MSRIWPGPPNPDRKPYDFEEHDMTDTTTPRPMSPRTAYLLVLAVAFIGAAVPLVGVVGLTQLAMLAWHGASGFAVTTWDMVVAAIEWLGGWIVLGFGGLVQAMASA